MLQNPGLGGKAEWTLNDLLDPTVWDECGGRAGLKDVSQTFMTLLAAGGKEQPLDVVCDTCGELKFIHKVCARVASPHAALVLVSHL